MSHALEDILNFGRLAVVTSRKPTFSAAVSATVTVKPKSPRRKRDSQRSKLYAAERATSMAKDRPWGSQPSLFVVDRYVQKILGDAKVRERWPNTHITVSHGGGRAASRALGSNGRGSIKMITVHRFPLLIIHEVAHVLAPHHALHCWEFAEVYLFLVRRMLGVAAHDELKGSFKKHKVRFTPKRTRTLTDDQKAELSARMSMARVKMAAARTLATTKPVRKIDGCDLALARANQA